jgi:hypothetical protein
MSNEPTIEQMNEAIAQFEGWQLIKGNPNHTCPSCDEGKVPSGWCTCYLKHSRFLKNGSCQSVTYFKYHSSWDWLIPVVEKAMNLRVKSPATYNPELMFRIEIVNGYTEIKGTGEKIFYNSSAEGSMLKATYKAVYQFIQWYNNQKEDKQ